MKDNTQLIQQNKTYSWRTPRRYNAYIDYLKDRFGSRVQKVIVDAGFSCPNRDGTKGFGGCTYCNNKSFKPPYCKPNMTISEQVKAGIEYLGRRYQVDRFMVYFQPYSNTHAPLEYLQDLYQQALEHPKVIGLAIGTRSDCIDESKIAYLEDLAGHYFITVEYGLESVYDRTLERINRQHNFQNWVDAVRMTAGRGVHICSHIILGLPGESREEILEEASIVSHYPIDSLKIHHLHIVEKTILAKQYLENPFPLFGYREYTEFVAEFLQHLRPDIAVQRLVGETHPRHLIAPNWGVRADCVQKDIEALMESKDVWQGKKFK